MDYKDLLKGVNAFATKGITTNENFPTQKYPEDIMDGSFYLNCVDQIKGALTLENLEVKVNRVKEKIMEFLKKWNRRVSINEEALASSISTFFSYQHFLNYNLESSNLWEYKNEIICIFSRFANAVKYTGASKALHLLNPNFFMMWDRKIRKEYGCYENSDGYFNFLLRSQFEIKEIIKSYKNSGLQGSISSHIYEGRERTILKLLDEYNYAKYTKGWL